MQRVGIQNNMKRLIATLALGLVAGVCATDLRAQGPMGGYGSREVTVSLTRPQKLKFYFVMGSSDLVFQYGPNLMQRQQFDSLAKRVAVTTASRIDSIVVTAFTSSTDSRIGSRELAEARIATVKDYLIRTLEHNELQGVRIWTHVRPAEEDVYDEEDDDALWMRDDDDDDVYNKVRCVEFKVYLSTAKGYGAVTRSEAQFNVTSELTEALSDTMSDAQKERQLAAIITNPYPVWRPAGKRRSYAVRDTRPVDQILSLRTNALYWLMFAPNGGVEFHIGGHFSILLEGAVTYWEKKTDTGDKGIYVAGGGPEFRYWTNEDRSEAGHVFGIYGQYADFDIKLNETGRQGTSIGGGDQLRILSAGGAAMGVRVRNRFGIFEQ